MNFYNNIHPYYCGIDLHARSLHVCIIDQDGNTCLHKEIPANPDKLQQLLEPYIGNIVLGVECIHCWYLSQRSQRGQIYLDKSLIVTSNKSVPFG